MILTYDYPPHPPPPPPNPKLSAHIVGSCIGGPLGGPLETPGSSPCPLGCWDQQASPGTPAWVLALGLALALNPGPWAPGFGLALALPCHLTPFAPSQAVLVHACPVSVASAQPNPSCLCSLALPPWPTKPRCLCLFLALAPSRQPKLSSLTLRIANAPYWCLPASWPCCSFVPGPRTLWRSPMSCKWAVLGWVGQQTTARSQSALHPKP